LRCLRHGGALSAIVFVCALIVSARESVAQTLPSGWQSLNVGTTVGSTSVNSAGTWTVEGRGANIWSTSDEFTFAHQSVTGDVDVTARLASLTASNQWSKAGVMIRAGLEADARNAFMLFAPGIGAAFQQRTSTGGSTSRVSGGTATPPTWVRISRRGNTFTAYRSNDGQTWTTVSTTTISMPSTAFVGLAVTSRDASATTSASFTNVAVEGSITEPAQPTWTGGDIGGPSPAGSSTISGGTFTVAGSGVDIWSTSDQFRYVYQRVTGDVEVIAQVSSFQAAIDWSKAGVMLRESLSAGSKNALLAVTGANGWTFQRRVATSAISYSTKEPTGSAPSWLRLVREADLVSAYYSRDGAAWTLLGTDTIPMTSAIYVGLAVTSHSPGSLATATFTNVTVRTPTLGTNQPPTVTLTAPSAGSPFTAPATIDMAATAGDTDGTVSRVEFYRGSTLVGSDTTSPFTASWTGAPAGTYSLTAVAVDDDGARTTSPAVSVNVGTSTNQLPTVALTSPFQNEVFTAPVSIYILATASDPDGSIARVDLYQGTTLLKSDTSSPYSFNWTNVAAGTYQLTAVARDNGGATRTSTPINVTVNGAGNQLPNTSITSPGTGAAFTAPANITIQATASDADGTIARVEFYRGSTLISTDTTSPYSATWSNASAGSYALTTRAYDNVGGSRTSTAVNVTVTTATNQAPTVSITSPTAGALFSAPASIAVAANASDPDGSVTSVDFYAGSQLVGTDTSSPYTATWSNVGAGTYSLTAIARDNSGATRTSTAVSVTVNVAGTLPTRIEFTPSMDHSTSNVTSYTVAIYRSSDPSTGVPVATRDLGKPTPVNNLITVDISTLVNPLPAGSYYAVVRSIGPGGTTASTPSSTFTK
jgi:regulation of enolase protein 1 (concanavalin A-like superfamily)